LGGEYRFATIGAISLVFATDASPGGSSPARRVDKMKTALLPF